LLGQGKKKKLKRENKETMAPLSRSRLPEKPGHPVHLSPSKKGRGGKGHWENRREGRRLPSFAKFLPRARSPTTSFSPKREGKRFQKKRVWGENTSLNGDVSITSSCRSGGKNTGGFFPSLDYVGRTAAKKKACGERRRQKERLAVDFLPYGGKTLSLRWKKGGGGKVQRRGEIGKRKLGYFVLRRKLYPP